MKWFFCWCQDSDFREDHGWQDLIRVAVHSARRHTTLEPHFVYDGEPSAFTAELAALGVNIIFHRLSFADALLSHQPENTMFQAVARGAFLRFDLPLFLTNDDRFVLYTDADVMFRYNPDFRGYYPGLIAAAPQFERGRRLDMNSGVILFNAVNYRHFYPQLVSFTRSNLSLGLDQEVLRAILGGDYLLLPDIYNWKPYWGTNAEASIVHWHGPKPVTIRKLLNGEVQQTYAAWQGLFERDEAAYRAYTAEFFELLTDYKSVSVAPSGAVPLSRGKPATASSFEPGFLPAAALDGPVGGRTAFRSQREANPWWQVDLGRFATITSIRIDRTAAPEADVCGQFGLAASIDGSSWVRLIDDAEAPPDQIAADAFVWSGPGHAWARYVRVTGRGGTRLALDQVEIFGRFD